MAIILNDDISAHINSFLKFQCFLEMQIHMDGQEYNYHTSPKSVRKCPEELMYNVNRDIVHLASSFIELIKEKHSLQEEEDSNFWFMVHLADLDEERRYMVRCNGKYIVWETTGEDSPLFKILNPSETITELFFFPFIHLLEKILLQQSLLRFKKIVLQ